MRTKNHLKTTLRTAVIGLSLFLLAVGLSFGQQLQSILQQFF